MDAQIETLDEKTEEQIEIALDELRSVQFCENTYTQAIEAHEEVEIIIRALAKRLTRRALNGALVERNSAGVLICRVCGTGLGVE